MLGLACGGCVKVQPGPDYQRTRDLLVERTGYDTVYSPEDEQSAADALDDLLARPLTVEDAARVALLNSPVLQSAFFAVGVARADLVQSTLFTNPTLAFGIMPPDGGGRTRVVASIGQQIADLWRIPVRKKIAAAQLEQTLLQTAQQGIALVATTRIACYRLLALEQARIMLDEGLALADRALRVASAELQAGEVSRLDVDLARSSRLQVELERQRIERDLITARADLARTLGLIRTPLRWTLVDSLPPPSAELPDDATLLATALLQRLDARRGMQQVVAAENELINQRLRVIPDVEVALDFERVENRTLPGRKVLADTLRSSVAAGGLTAPGLQTRGERRVDKSQIIDAVLGPTLTLTLPIWDQNQAQVARARYALEASRRDLESLLNDIAYDVLAAAAAVRTSAALVRTFDEKLLPVAESNRALALELYEQGEQSILAVLNSQVDLVRLRRDAIDARRDYAIAVAQLEQAIAGRLADVPGAIEPATTEPPGEAP